MSVSVRVDGLMQSAFKLQRFIHVSMDYGDFMCTGYSLNDVFAL